MLQPDFLRLLYEDASSGTGFDRALVQVAEGFHARVAHLLALDGVSGAPTWGLLADLSGSALAEAARQYEQHHWRHDPRRRALKLLRPGLAVRCQHLIDEREVRGSEFFQDYFLPIDLRWTLIGRLPQAVGASESVDLALVRDPRRAGFDDREKTSLEQLLPHLEVALGLQRRIARAQTGERAFMESGQGLVVFDARLDVVGSTPGTAEALGRYAGSLRFSPDTGRRGQRPLARALRDCLVDGIARHLSLRVGGGAARDGAAETVWLSVTRRRASTGGYEVVLLVRWPARGRLPDLPMLMGWLNLTRVEAELGLALLHGQTPRQMWQARKRSAATIRSQLRSLYAKANVAGQVEFVRLVGGLGKNGAAMEGEGSGR
ncbi:MAG: hypothetical protein JNM79_14360 [Burkholderiales bacterium]|nr:hypothetical protein [Burkholderiales bacterium]